MGAVVTVVPLVGSGTEGGTIERMLNDEDVMGDDILAGEKRESYRSR